MPAIQHLLQRWGFVKLRKYGLELTADGRILSTRSAVLDDGTGGQIVGWQDGDVSIGKLSRWPGPPGVGSEVASGAIAIVTSDAASLRPSPAVAPAIPASAQAEAAPAVPSRSSARVMRAEVAGEPTMDEDDWEWTIALARAQVAVVEAEVARPPAVAPRLEPPAPRPPERPTLRSSATADLAASGDWRKTDTAEAFAYEDYRIASHPASEPSKRGGGIQLPRVVPAVATPRTTTPSTVIPVPSLPTADATRRAQLGPVVRTPPSSTLTSRFTKGTGPVDPVTPLRTRPAAMIVEDTIPNLSVGDRTRPGVAPATRRRTAAPAAELDEPAPPPSSGDQTQPGIALPPMARIVALPSIKRRTAR